jgi:type I restriction enzyme S subunit
MSVIPSEVLTPEFLYFYFLNVDMRALGTGSSIPQINNYDIAPLKISFPKFKEKQVELTEMLRSIEAECHSLEAIYRLKLTSLDDLKKSLLHQAFSGQLTQ